MDVAQVGDLWRWYLNDDVYLVVEKDDINIVIIPLFATSVYLSLRTPDFYVTYKKVG